MLNPEKMERAKWKELYAWWFGAMVAALGIGAYFSNYLQQYALWIVIIGLAIHLPAMYKIFSRK